MKITFRGKEYQTISSCYRDNEDIAVVTLATFTQRIKRDFTVEEALTTPKQKTIESRLGSHLVEGKIYENLPSIAAAYRMTFNAIYKRYSRGCRGDDLIPVKKRKNYVAPERKIKTSRFEIEVGGVKYRSALRACEALGVNYTTYRKRLQKNWTQDEALQIVPRHDGRFGKATFSFRNEDLTADELSDRFNISTFTILDRINRGASVEQAVGLEEIKKGTLITQAAKRKTVKRKLSRPHLEVDGQVFKSYKALADAYSLPYYTVRSRIVEYGYSPSDAVKLKGKGTEVVVEGIIYKSIAAAASAYGIPVSLVLAKMNNKLTLEQALGIEEYDTPNTVEFEGKKYKSIKHLAQEKGISYATIQQRRLSSKLTLSEAIAAGSRIINKGRYNETIFERDPELANKDGELYFIKILLNDKIYFKVGITVKSVDDRINYTGLLYEVISTKNGKMLDLYRIEQKILASFKDRRIVDASAKLLDGYTELLDVTEEEAKSIELLIEEGLSAINKE